MTRTAKNTVPAIIEKFVDKTSGCWLWVGALYSNGYAKVKFHMKARLAHRVIYEGLVGNIPEGLELDHLCRNRNCVNPSHLDPVTHQTNCDRGLGGKRAHCRRGHILSGENLWIGPTGMRRCKQCGNINRRMRKANKSGVKNG